MKFRGWDYIDHMVDTCEEIFEYLNDVKSFDEFEADGKTRRAVVMCLLDLGELFKGLTDGEKDEYPSEHWHNIIGFRNRSAHGYHTLDFEMVYSIAANRIPEIYPFLKKKQEQMNNG